VHLLILLYATCVDFFPLPTTTSTPLFTFTPLHSAPTASSIHLHVVISTFSRTKSSRAFAPGASDRMAKAQMRGMCRAEDRRVSVDVARGTIRVGCVLFGVLTVERWMRVGRCAWTGERDGFGCGSRTMLIGLGASSSGVELSFVDASIVAGPFRAAKASRWRVTALMPMRMCLPTCGGGGGGSDVVGSSLLFLFLFRPLEGSICVLRWSPSGARRLMPVNT
jgi:hypothetical protein